MRLPSPKNDYTEFDNLFSGVGEHMKGTFQIDGPAVGFRYQKNIIADGLPYDTRIRRDNWKIQLLERDGENARVMFEQSVNYGLNIIARAYPIAEFIAYPTDNEQITTTIINGETIDPATAKNYLDLGYKTEDGIDIESFYSEGVIGGIFNGIWQSPMYKQRIEPGYVFRIVQDGWRPIGLSRIATYKVSYKGAESQNVELFHERTGQRFWVKEESKDGTPQTSIYRSRRGISPLATDKVEQAGSIKNALISNGQLVRISGGALLFVGKVAGALVVYQSTDEGKNWKNLMSTTVNITPLASCLTADVTRFCIYGRDSDGKAAYAVLKCESEGWAVAESGLVKPIPETLVLPLKGNFSMSSGQGGVLRILVRDTDSSKFRVLLSKNGGKSYSEEKTTGEEGEEPAPQGGQ